MTKIRIRKANNTDTENLAQLNIRCWNQSYRGLLADEILNNMSIDSVINGYAIFFKFNHTNKSIYVAELNQNIIGFCTCAQIENKKSDYEILALYIEQNYWRIKIGSKLLRHVEWQLKKISIRNLWVSTLKNNIRAQNFYHSCGFESTLIEKEFRILDFCYPELVLHKQFKY